MSKELEYEINNFANLLHKDCMNLMECLKKQGEDNKPILYLGKHYQKVILPYEEYQKMCNRLEAIDNAEPSEALECFENLRCNLYNKPYLDKNALDDCNTIKQALLKAQKEHKALEVLEKIIDFDLVEIGSRKVCIYSDDDNGDIVKMISEEEFNALEEVL